MVEQAELKLFEGVAPVGERVLLVELVQWMREEAAPAWLDGYLFLKARGVRYRDAMLAVWLSLRTDDRGEVRTRGDFARLMGVARATTYGWEGRRPEIRQWAELLQVMRMRGMRLAEVDERTYWAAVDEEGSATDRKLYYQRAGVWEDMQRLRVVGDGDGPVQYVDVTNEEIEAIRRALAEEAAGGGTEG